MTFYRYGEFLQRSTDNGLTWKALPLPEGDYSWDGTRAFTNPIQAGVLYYIQADGNIFLSTDSGASWEHFSFIKSENPLYQPSLLFDSEAKPL
jgi:hypothetical protein